MSEHGSSAKAILYAFLANLGIALSKLAAAIYTHSGSMLAEAIHSFADCGNQVLLYIGLRQSQRPPTPQHPLGFGKISYFWSFIVALMLFSVGGLFSIQEGWHKLHSHEPIRQAWVALLVLGLSIGLETFSTLGCLREINKQRRGRTLRQWVETTRNAELVVVLGEDLAALVGLVLAFVFVSMAAYTGNPIYDAFGSIVIGVVLIIVSLFIAVRIKGLIVGKSAEEDVQKALHEHIESTEGIEDLLNAITFQLGPQVMLAIKVRMTSGITIEQAVRCLNAMERSIKARFPEVAWCFVEPDTTE